MQQLLFTNWSALSSDAKQTIIYNGFQLLLNFRAEVANSISLVFVHSVLSLLFHLCYPLFHFLCGPHFRLFKGTRLSHGSQKRMGEADIIMPPQTIFELITRLSETITQENGRLYILPTVHALRSH